MNTPHPAHRRPARVTLDGRYVRLEPIGPQHAADLYRAATMVGAEGRFRYLFEQPPIDEADMAAFVGRMAGSDVDPLMWAIIDRTSGRAEGRQQLMRIVPEHGVIELGSIYWGPAMARTRLATEAFYLAARHVFDDLGFRRLEWKCNDRNEPSKRAARRFGFSYEGLFRQHMIVKGESRDTAWFAMLEGDWPRLRSGYERWLDPGNFEAEGTQKLKLAFD